MKRRWCSARAGCGLVLALTMAMIFVAYIAREWLLSSAGHWLNVAVPLAEPVDDLLVLGGDSETRPLAAAAIIRAGLAQRVLVPQVKASGDVIDGIFPPPHEIVRQVLLQSGVGPDQIQLLPMEVDSTDREAQCLSDHLQRHPGLRVAVVTNDYHTRRTRLVFSRVCGPYAASLSIVGAPTDGYNPTNWWQYESGFVQYVNEYLKLARTCLF